MTLYLPVIHGTMRDGGRSIHVARFVRDRIGTRDDVETDLFEPDELPFGNLVEREWEMDPRPDAVAAFVDEMDRADGFVVVSPEYNHGYPGALKNILDHLYDEWNRKPFALATAGGVSGGTRVAEQLRLVVAGLGAVSVPRAVHVTRVGSVFDEDGPTEDRERWTDRVDGLVDELVWYARALAAARGGAG